MVKDLIHSLPPIHQKTLLILLFEVDVCLSIPQPRFLVRHPKARERNIWWKEDLEPRG